MFKYDKLDDMLKKFLFLFLIAVSFFCFSQEEKINKIKQRSVLKAEPAFDIAENSPVWLLLEYAKKEREDKNHSDALILLYKAYEKDDKNPNVLYQIGLTYKLLGEYQEALTFFEKTLKIIGNSNSRNNIIKNETYYQLAETNKFLKNYQKYEDSLLIIVHDDKLFTENTDNNLLLRGDRGEGGNYLQILTGMKEFVNNRTATPLDQLVYMFRVKDSFSKNANFFLGEYYFETNKSTKSALHLVYFILKIYTRIIDNYRENVDLNYQFSTSDNLFSLIRKKEKYMNYIRSTNFAKALNYLGLVMVNLGGNPQIQIKYAKEIWKLVYTYNFDSESKTNARHLLSLSDEEIKKYIETFRERFAFRYRK